MNRGEQIIASCWEVMQKKMCLESYYLKRKLSDYKPSEVHCIQYIGEHPDSNVTKLAEAFQMTTGGVTKLTKKLIEKNLIEAYKSLDNRKEVYFRLTQEGEQIEQIHHELEKEFQDRDNDVFCQVTEKEFSSIMGFLKRYNRHLDQELQNAKVDVTSGVLDRL